MSEHPDLADFADCIVVGTDGSPTAKGAIEWAARRAVRDRVKLVVLTSVPAVSVPSRAQLREARQSGTPVEYIAQDRAERRAAEGAEQARTAHPGLVVESCVETGEAWEPLVSATRSADLVVVGARGESATFRARMLGGNADAVVTRAEGPVVVVPQGIADVESGPVVVGFDGSEAAERALVMALDEADRAQSELVIIHAWDPTQRVREGGASWVPDERSVQDWLHDAVDSWVTQKPDVDVRYLASPGPAAQQLIDVSRQASLVVVGSRGRGGVAGLLLGSVSRSVLRGAHCPVLVTRSPRPE